MILFTFVLILALLMLKEQFLLLPLFRWKEREGKKGLVLYAEDLATSLKSVVSRVEPHILQKPSLNSLVFVLAVLKESTG